MEDEVFHRRLVDHLLFGLTAAALLWAAAAYLEALFLAPAFTMALVWLVCQRNPPRAWASALHYAAWKGLFYGGG